MKFSIDNILEGYDKKLIANIIKYSAISILSLMALLMIYDMSMAEIFFHILFSLVLLALVTVGLFLIGYLYVKIYLFFKRKFSKDKDDRIDLYSKKSRKVFLFLLAFNTLLYVQQLYEWTGKGSAYLKAKPYYATGNVVAFYRSSLATFIHPDFPLVFPLVYLQYPLSFMGEMLLPKDDGELAMWRYHWYVYPYAKTMSQPTKYAPPIGQYTWDAIKAMGENNFKDKNIQEKNAYRDLPGATMFMYVGTVNFPMMKHTIHVTPKIDKKIDSMPIVFTHKIKSQLLIVSINLKREKIN